MARRPLALRSLAVAALCALAHGCNGSARESASPPPITASSTPAPSAAPAANPSTFSTPASERAAMEERVVPPPPPTPAPAAAPAADASAAASAKPEATPDPLKWLQDQQARKADYDRRVANLEVKLASARDLVAVRERELLAFKNPFLARPQLTSEEAAAIEGMDGAARVHWSEGRLADANAALEAAQKAYDDAKANPPPQ